MWLLVSVSYLCELFEVMNKNAYYDRQIYSIERHLQKA